MGSKSSKSNEYDNHTLSEQELYLLVANTHFNETQIRKFYDDFLIDCPSGRLTKKDFIRLFKSLHPQERKHSRADAYCDYVFNAFDSDSNGYIDFHEFLIAFSITSFGSLKEKVQFAFQIFDLDKNNKIDKNELTKIVYSLYDLNGIPESERKGDNDPKKRVDEIMYRLDINRDNLISVDEFVNGCLKDETIKKILIDPLYK